MKFAYRLMFLVAFLTGCGPDSGGNDPVYGPVHNMNGTFDRFFKAGLIGDTDYKPRLDFVRHEPLRRSDLKEGEDVGLLLEDIPADIKANMNYPHVVVTTSKEGKVTEETLTNGGLRVARYGRSQWQIVVPLDFAKSLFTRGDSQDVEWTSITIKALYHVAIEDLGRIFPKILDLVPSAWRGENPWSRVGQVMIPMATSRVGRLSGPADWAQEANEDAQFVQTKLVSDPAAKGAQPAIVVEKKIEDKTQPFGVKITLKVRSGSRCETEIVEGAAPARKIESGCVIADNRLIIEKVGQLLLRSNKTVNGQAVYSFRIRPTLLSENTRLRFGDPRDFDVVIGSAI